jgi:hypothetical protein
MEYIKIIIEAFIFALVANGFWPLLEFIKKWVSDKKDSASSSLSSRADIDIKMIKKNFEKLDNIYKDFGSLRREQQELKDDLEKANKGFKEARSSFSAKGTMIEVIAEKLARIEQSLKVNEVQQAVERILQYRKEVEGLVQRAANWRDECNNLAINFNDDRDSLIKRIETLEDCNVNLRQTISKK